MSNVETDLSDLRAAFKRVRGMVMFNIFSKKTNFDADGWVEEEGEIQEEEALLATPRNFVAPRKVDFRDMCLKTSDQGQTPHCTGYSTAGYIEVQNWRRKHYPEQIDGDSIYK